jgi:hypothetical protein
MHVYINMHVQIQNTLLQILSLGHIPTLVPYVFMYFIYLCIFYFCQHLKGHSNIYFVFLFFFFRSNRPEGPVTGLITTYTHMQTFKLFNIQFCICLFIFQLMASSNVHSLDASRISRYNPVVGVCVSGMGV